MSNLAAIITGLALASILVAAVSVRRDEARPVAAARLEVPVPPKADRLPLPAVPTAHESVLIASSRTSPMESVERVMPRHTEDREGVKVPQAKMQERDPVCGARGRTWYTKDNGWRFWKCQR